MLRRIGLSNFKCWRELDIELAPITLLFGANSSGKSAILQSLLMLKQTARGIDPGQHINFGGGDRDYVDLGSYQDLARGHGIDVKIGIQLSWQTSSTIIFLRRRQGAENMAFQGRELNSLAYEVNWGIDEHIFVDRLHYDMYPEDNRKEWISVNRDQAGRYVLTSSFSNDEELIKDDVFPQSCYIVPESVPHESEAGDRMSILNLSGEFEQFVDKLHYVGPLRLRPRRFYPWTGSKPEIIEPDGANAIQSLIASARGDRRLLSSQRKMLQGLNLIDDFDVRPIGQHERLFEATATIAGIESSLVDVGFGVSQVLPVITMLLMAPKKSIILLEQPELHLHPNAQSALADLLLDVAETRNLQLIIESHSEHVLRRLQVRIAEEHSKFATPDNIKTYFCEPDTSGSTASEVELDRFGQIANWPDKFLGDISGDLHTMAKAAIRRRREELVSG